MKQVTYGLSANGLGMEVNGRFYPWGSVAASVAQVRDGLEEEIASFHDCEPTLPEAVDDHEERIKSLEGKEQALFQTLNTAFAKVLACEQDIKKLAKRIKRTEADTAQAFSHIACRLADPSLMKNDALITSNPPLHERLDALEAACRPDGIFVEELAKVWKDIDALQHAACETARMVLEDEERLITFGDTPPGEIHMEQDGVTYIHRPDEVIHTELIDDRPLTEAEKEYAGTIHYTYGDPEPDLPPRLESNAYYRVNSLPGVYRLVCVQQLGGGLRLDLEEKEADNA